MTLSGSNGGNGKAASTGASEEADEEEQVLRWMVRGEDVEVLQDEGLAPSVGPPPKLEGAQVEVALQPMACH